MKQQEQSGFTIIETLMFLAITGLMVVGVMFGASRSVNYQRYKDSVISLQSIIQQQYSDVTNVINNHDNTWLCDSGVTSQSASPTSIVRGQSDCVILGKFIRTTDSKTILISDVIGYIPSASVAGLNDFDVFVKSNIPPLPDGYGIYVSTVDPQTYEISWGASLTEKVSGGPMQFSMLVVRSPISGAIKTFFNDSFVIDTNVGNIVNIASVQEGNICLDSNDLFAGTKMAINIVAGSSSASGVEVMGDNSGCN